ncbi:MAG TPA: hypothetical protein VFO00_09375 [Vitreimonas sp.]|nr:hypothetical protein [Vitreimonas sp.]
MAWGFWFGILVVVAIVIGASVLVGKMLSRPGGSEHRRSRHQEMMALKASGALKHRKSNQE